MGVICFSKDDKKDKSKENSHNQKIQVSNTNNETSNKCPCCGGKDLIQKINADKTKECYSPSCQKKEDIMERFIKSEYSLFCKNCKTHFHFECCRA